MPTNSTSKHQVIIIGGGPAGTACAINLCRSGVKDVLVLESGEYEKFRIGESIPPEANSIFAQMGIWEAFLEEKHDPCYGSVSYWGDDRRGYNDSLMSPFGHGWHLDRRRFNKFLAREAVNAGATVLTSAKFLRARETADRHLLLSYKKEGQKVTAAAQIVVDASGTKSVFTAGMGSEKLPANPLICLAARFKNEGPESSELQLTHLEAVEYGWWYTARLPDETMLVTLYTDPETVNKLQLNKTVAWSAHLKATKNTWSLVKAMPILDTTPKGFPAPSYRLDKIAGENWLAIGDAATAYDPITSQGITKSLMNAEVAAKMIAHRLASKLPDFELFQQMTVEAFEQYLAQRKHYYQLEQRWAGSAFWGRLQGEIIVT